MDQRETLMTFAELSLALGGFTGIVLALRSRNEGGLGVPRPALESLLVIVFGAAIIPTVCVATLHFGIAPSVVWRLGSLLMAGLAIVWFAAVVPRLVRTSPPSGTFRFLRLPLLAISAVNGIAQALNVIGGFPVHAFGVMFLGLTWYFISGSLAFAGFLLREDAA